MHDELKMFFFLIFFSISSLYPSVQVITRSANFNFFSISDVMGEQ